MGRWLVTALCTAFLLQNVLVDSAVDLGEELGERALIFLLADAFKLISCLLREAAIIARCFARLQPGDLWPLRRLFLITLVSEPVIEDCVHVYCRLILVVHFHKRVLAWQEDFFIGAVNVDSLLSPLLVTTFLVLRDRLKIRQLLPQLPGPLCVRLPKVFD